MKKTYFFILFIITILICISLIPPFTLQFFYLSLVLAIIIMTLAVLTRSLIIKYFFLCIFSCILTISALELIYFFLEPSTKYSIKHTRTQAQGPINNPILIDKPKPHRIIHAKGIYAEGTKDEQILYDVYYTLQSPSDHRFSPNSPNAEIAVVLLGCSYAFGYGLADTEHLAWQLGKNLGKKYQVFNLSRSGEGIHYILKRVEDNQFPQDLKHFSKILFYYVGIDDHQLRLAGLRGWDKKGPYYELENHEAILRGKLEDVPNFFWKNGQLGHILSTSTILKKHELNLVTNLIAKHSEQHRRKLTQAMINKINIRLKELYPQSSLSMLAWPYNTNNKNKLLQLPADMDFIDMMPWFPNYAENPRQYNLPKDVHPNAKAIEVVSAEFAKLIQEDAQK